MASTYTASLRLENQADGENDGSWGQIADQVFAMLEEAITGYLEIDVSGSSNVTLTTNNNATDQARQQVLKLTGTLTGNINVICPDIEKTYWVWNATSGAYTITFKTSTGTGETLTQGTKNFVIADGTNAVKWWGSDTAATLTVAEGGTGATTEAGARQSLLTLFNTTEAISANETVGASDCGRLYKVDSSGGDIDFNLPACSTVGAGFTVALQKISSDSNDINVDPNGADTINGDVNYELDLQWDIVILVSDGVSSWNGIIVPEEPAILRTKQVREYSRQIYPNYTELSYSSSKTLDFNSEFSVWMELQGAVTFQDPTNLRGGSTYSVFLVQDSSGGHDVAFSSKWKFAIAPDLSSYGPYQGIEIVAKCHDDGSNTYLNCSWDGPFDYTP